MLLMSSKIAYSETFFWEDKKGIHTTDDVSNLPPKFRDKYEQYIKNNPKVAPKIVQSIPDSAKNAVRALKKLEARCQAGISKISDYSAALGDAKFEVNMFVESSESNDFESLKSSIMQTMKHYDDAGDYFSRGAAEYELNNLRGHRVEALESKQRDDNLGFESISLASKELAISFALLNKK